MSATVKTWMLYQRSCRLVKWVIIFMLMTTFFYYCIHFNRQSSLLEVQETRKCLKGDQCYVTTVKTTKRNKINLTKKPVKSKKFTKVANLEKVHILPENVNLKSKQLYATSQAHISSRTFRKILIISYFDVSAPYIGDIISQHPDVFYINEPLQPFDSSSLKDGEEPISRRNIDEAIEYMSELFDCRILSSKFGYTDKLVKKIAKKAFVTCGEKQVNVSECVQEMCKAKHFVLSKTIRVYIQDIQAFLMRNRGMAKVLILQRDPRVNLHLRNRRGNGEWTSGSDMFFQGRSLCSRMLHDVQAAKRLESTGHKDFYRIVLYEHFLKDPESVIKGVFSFIGVSVKLSDVKQLLKNVSAYKELRKIKLNKWEWLPDDDACLGIDKACMFFYKNSFYNPMQTSLGFVQRNNLCKYCD